MDQGEIRKVLTVSVEVLTLLSEFIKNLCPRSEVGMEKES